MKKHLLTFLLSLLVMAYGATAFALPQAPIWPTGGEDGYIMVKSGDHQAENDFHMRWLNGTQKSCFITFDAAGNTQYVGLADYSLSTHKHNMSELLGTDTFLYPHSALADSATHANAATHATSADTAHIADNGMKGLVDESTPKEAEGYYFHNNKWILGKTDMPVGGTKGQIAAKKTDADYDVEWVTASIPPAPEKPNQLLAINDKKQVLWIDKGSIVDQPLQEMKNFYQICMYVCFVFWLLFSITTIILFIKLPKKSGE